MGIPGSRRAAIAIGLTLATIGCDEIRKELTVPDITLRVTDTSCTTATVAWDDGSDDETEVVVSLPWSRELGKPSGLIMVVSARRECDDDGTITAQIELDGDLEDRGTATGPRAVASAAAGFF